MTALLGDGPVTAAPMTAYVVEARPS